MDGDSSDEDPANTNQKRITDGISRPKAAWVCFFALFTGRKGEVISRA